MNEEKEYNVITLENGIEYTEIDRINFNNNCYNFNNTFNQ